MPVRSRSRVSISAMICLPERLIVRRSSSSRSTPSRTIPPSRASAGASSRTVRSIASRTSARSSSSATSEQTSGARSSASSVRTRGTIVSDCFRPRKSRGPGGAERDRGRPADRDPGPLSGRRGTCRGRWFETPVPRRRRADRESVRARPAVRAATPAAAGCRSTVTVRSSSSSSDPARPPSEPSTISRCLSVVGSMSSVSRRSR